jgi:hypothetical protein
MKGNVHVRVRQRFSTDAHHNSGNGIRTRTNNKTAEEVVHAHVNGRKDDRRRHRLDKTNEELAQVRVDGEVEREESLTPISEGRE